VPPSRPDQAHSVGVLTEPITSAANPLIKRAASLRLRKYRTLQRAFLAEGADLVIAGILSGRRPQAVFVTAGGPAARSLAGEVGEVDAAAAGGGLAGVLAGVSVHVVTERVAEKLTTLETPPDVMAVFGVPQPPQLETLGGPTVLAVYVDRVADPGNLGTLLRSAVALGVSALATSPGCVDPLSPKVVRAGMGAVFALPVYPEMLLVELCRGLGESTVYGLAAHGGADLRAAELRRPAVLCVGAERAGLSKQVAGLCDELLTIPLSGATRSGASPATPVGGSPVGAGAPVAGAGSESPVEEGPGSESPVEEGPGGESPVEEGPSGQNAPGEAVGGDSAPVEAVGGVAVESLNAGVAGSIALYEFSRRTAGLTER